MTDTIILDVRDRLARIEVKIDNTHEKLTDHDRRICANKVDIEGLQKEVSAFKTSVKVVSAVAAVIGTLGATVAWIIDHGSMLAHAATAMAN